MTAATALRARGGRPRDPGVDGRILDAVTSLLASERVQHFSMDEIASRAGVGKAGIYRRWPTSSHVIAAALLRMAAPVDFPERSSLREDLLILVTATVTGQDAMAVVGVLGELGVDPILRDAYLSGPRLRLLEGIEAVRVYAIERGDPAPDTCTVLAAVAYLQWSALVSGREPDAEGIAGVVDAVVVASAPRG